MDKTNLELFKQALNEAVSNQFDNTSVGSNEEIVCSEKHNLAMRTIVYGKIDTPRTWTPKMKRIIAILVAAAILLTSCGIIFRNEIREVVEKIYESFTMISYIEEAPKDACLEKIYELEYLPNGYSLENEYISYINVRYKFTSENGGVIWFSQSLLDGSKIFLDNESGYSKMVNIGNYEIYLRVTDENYLYVWNDGKYSMQLKSNLQLSDSEIVSILNGIKAK